MRADFSLADAIYSVLMEGIDGDGTNDNQIFQYNTLVPKNRSATYSNPHILKLKLLE